MSRLQTAPKFTLKHAPMPENMYSIKAPYKMVPEGITFHETDNEAPAINEVAYMQRNQNLVSWHIVVDAENIILASPLDRNTWHAGDGREGKGNRTTIAIEIAGNYRRTGANIGQPTDWYRKARANAEMVGGWLVYIFGFKRNQLYMHNHWSGKNCPRVILRERYFDTLVKNVMNHANAYIQTPIQPAKPIVGVVNVGDVVQIKSTAKNYANVAVAIPGWVKKGSYRVLDVKPDRVRLADINSWVLLSDIVGVVVKEAPKQAVFKVGDLVTVREGAKSYNGVSVIKQWYTTVKRIDSIKGKRAVLDVGNWETPFNTDDLIPAKPVVAPKPTPKPVKEKVVLSAKVATWGFYNLTDPPNKQYIKGYLRPAKFEGLVYDILDRPRHGVVTIQTIQFGKVNIYIGSPGETAHTIIKG